MLTTATRLFHRLREAAGIRLELFLLEVIEERIRIVDALLLAALAIVCVLMTLVALTATVVVFFWDTHRLLALAVVTVVYAVTAVVTLLKLRSHLRRWQSFPATLEEFKKDSACFKKPN